VPRQTASASGKPFAELIHQTYKPGKQRFNSKNKLKKETLLRIFTPPLQCYEVTVSLLIVIWFSISSSTDSGLKSNFTL
jgi:hypothetical protein